MGKQVYFKLWQGMVTEKDFTKNKDNKGIKAHYNLELLFTIIWLYIMLN